MIDRVKRERADFIAIEQYQASVTPPQGPKPLWGGTIRVGVAANVGNWWSRLCHGKGIVGLFDRKIHWIEASVVSLIKYLLPYYKQR